MLKFVKMALYILLNSLNNLLDYSHICIGKFQIIEKEVNLNEIIFLQSKLKPN